MPDGDQSKDKGASVNPFDASAGATDTSEDGSNNEKTVTLSKLVESVTGSLNQFKDSLFSKEDLKTLDIVPSAQNLPCTFDICLTKEGLLEHETTRIKSSLKHILTSKCSLDEKGQDSKAKETYSTYVEVGIEHHVSPSLLVSWGKRIIRVFLIVITVVSAIFVGSCLIERCTAQKRGIETSWLFVCHFNGTTNLTQKVVLNIQRGVERK